MIIAPREKEGIPWGIHLAALSLLAYWTILTMLMLCTFGNTGWWATSGLLICGYGIYARKPMARRLIMLMLPVLCIGTIYCIHGFWIPYMSGRDPGRILGTIDNLLTLLIFTAAVNIVVLFLPITKQWYEVKHETTFVTDLSITTQNLKLKTKESFP